MTNDVIADAAEESATQRVKAARSHDNHRGTLTFQHVDDALPRTLALLHAYLVRNLPHNTVTLPYYRLLSGVSTVYRYFSIVLSSMSVRHGDD